MGTPAFAVPCVETLHAHPDCTLIACVTQPDRKRGRHKEPQAPPVKVAAQQQGVPVFQPRKLKSGAFPETLASMAPDLIVVTAYGRILPPSILSLPRLGCVNVHASLLPRWRGAAPIQWAIAEGDSESGVCLMVMDEGLDTGPVLASQSTPIAPTETGESLHDRLSTMGASLLGDRLNEVLNQALTPQIQEEGSASYARMLKREDSWIDWRCSANSIANQIRGFYPWPGASTTIALNGQTKRLKLFPTVEPGERPTDSAPGTLVEVTNDALIVACGDGVLAIREVQLEDRKRLKVSELLRGQPIEALVQLGLPLA